MVLVDATRDLVLPDAPATKLVAVATLVEEYVPSFKAKFLYLRWRRGDGLHLGEIEIASLHVRDSQVGNLY